LPLTNNSLVAASATANNFSLSSLVSLDTIATSTYATGNANYFETCVIATTTTPVRVTLIIIFIMIIMSAKNNENNNNNNNNNFSFFCNDDFT
jgi:hypothetical protein